MPSYLDKVLSTSQGTIFRIKITWSDTMNGRYHLWMTGMPL
jgi:hypothetical protein